MPGFLGQLAAIFCLSVGVILACHRLRIPVIAGFLLTGVAVGPSALGLVHDPHEVEALAEVGVVMLLFAIGMELSGGHLSRMRKNVFVGGPIQTGLTILVFAGLFAWMGNTPGPSLFFGFLAALSSTAIVLKVYQQRAELDSPHGRVVLSILVFQDILVAPLMLLTPVLAGKDAGGGSLPWLAVQGVGLLGAAWVLSRKVVPPLMHAVVRTRSRELFLVSVLALCLCVTWVTSAMGLSLSLGAFLAGLIIAESEYSLSAMEGILPFRDVFTSLFFISVGMLLDLSFVQEHLGQVLLLAGVIVVFKTVPAGGAVLILGFPLRTACIAALGLAQVGEFSFVLAKAGMAHGLLSNDQYQLILSAAVLVMCATPFIIAQAPRLAGLLPLPAGGFADHALPSASERGLEDHLLIVGFGLGGRHMARAARAAGIPYQILEMNPDTVRTAREEGEPITYGDAIHPDILRHMGVDRARVLTVMVSDPAAVRGVVHMARLLNPALHIVVRTRFLGELAELRELGADEVVPEELETSVEVFTRVLARYMVPRADIEGFVDQVRAESYEMLRRADIPGESVTSLASRIHGADVSVLAVEPGSALDGRTLAESMLRSRHGLTVVAVSRNGDMEANPGAGWRLTAGDQVYVFGARRDISARADLFTNPAARARQTAQAV